MPIVQVSAVERPEDASSFIDEERAVEEDHASGPVQAAEAVRPKSTELGRFFDVEDPMEEGEAPTEILADDAMDVDQAVPLPVAVAAATEGVRLVERDTPPVFFEEGSQEPSSSQFDTAAGRDIQERS
jgi:hypothetical protein